MKSDIDALMQARKIDALVVLGDAQHNPAMVYFTGRGHINNAILVKEHGKDAVIFCNDMEREEASRSGLKVNCYSEYPMDDFTKASNGDTNLASAMRIQKMFSDLGLVSGNVSLYGRTEFGTYFSIFNHLQKLAPELSFVGENSESSIILKAMETKDEQ